MLRQHGWPVERFNTVLLNDSSLHVPTRLRFSVNFVNRLSVRSIFAEGINRCILLTVIHKHVSGHSVVTTDKNFSQTSLLGDVNSRPNLPAADHVSLLAAWSSLLYALRVLRSHGLPDQSPKDLFHDATVIRKLIYCAPARGTDSARLLRSTCDLTHFCAVA